MAGTEPLRYQWRKGNAAIVNATNAFLRLENVQAANAGLYSVVVSNLATKSSGTNSQTATLIVMSDFDRDRMGDAWETQFGYATNSATDAGLDRDGDGYTTLQEFIAGTDPSDPQSYLRIRAIERTSTGPALSFLVGTNRGYGLQYRERLDRGSWQRLTQIPGRTQEREVTTGHRETCQPAFAPRRR